MLIIDIYYYYRMSLGRLAFILRQRLPVIIFVIAAIIGGILIFWYINNKEAENNSSNQEYAEIQENIPVNEDADVQISEENASFKDHGQLLSSSIPYGLRAVNLPISFFGDASGIRQGDRVDIISVFYDPGSNELYSEVILSQKEIILLENTGKDQDPGMYQDAGGSEYFGDGIFEDISPGNGVSGQYKKILVITFYLESIEAEKAFMAIESGQLYLSLCPSERAEI